MTMISVDLFCGGGGASEGIRDALGVSPRLAVNHDPAAIAMHLRNHPDTAHRLESVWDVSPWDTAILPRGKHRIDHLHASPDCTHFSRARGGKPRQKNIRSLADVVIKWARAVAPRVITLENVAEFEGWGPLDAEGKVIKARKGEMFRRWVLDLELCGYQVEWRVLVAADYGAPTSRKRLFIIARCDGQPIVWPEPSHGPGRAQPWRTAAECIDWSIPCPSIFTRKRELAENTQRRIARGLMKYVLNHPDPYIVRIGHTSSDSGKVHSLHRPLSTITSKNEHLLCAPWLINTRNGERAGQLPRVRSLQQPAPTVTATGSQGALVAAWLAKHNKGATGQPATEPMHTITSIDTKRLVAAHIIHHRGASIGRNADAPLPTITSSGMGHLGLVAAFLTKYYGQGSQASALTEPMHTIVSKARMGLVTVAIGGEEYAVVDIGMRMLQPRELARAQGFDDDYILTGTKTQQIARIGRSVPRQVIAAIVRANLNRHREVA